MTISRIVILGGYGTFGRLIAEQLARSGAQLVIAGRSEAKGRAFADSLQVEFVRCDVRDTGSLRAATSGAQLVINAAGPFPAGDYSIPETCLAQGCHYIDLGDGREYVAGIDRLNERAKVAGLFVCVGASTTPAITSAAVTELRASVPTIRSIKVALTAGNKNQAGVSTIASILAYVGAPVRVWQEGQWQVLKGWSQGEVIRFPPPVGRRRVQLCDVPDLALFPDLFAAQSVVFKAGVELTVLNYAIGALALVKRLRPATNLAALAPLMVRLSTLAKPLGSFRGSFAVWVTDAAGQERSLAFVAPKNGPRVPSAPAVLLVRRLLREGIPAAGAFPCVEFIGLAEFTAYLAPYGIFVVRGENGAWST